MHNRFSVSYDFAINNNDETIDYYPVILSYLLQYDRDILYQLFLLIFIPLGLLSLFGATKKNDLRIFPYLLVVIPAQIIGYGLGFILNFIKRYILNQGSWTGFKKRYYA